MGAVVLGLGASLSLYKPAGELTIGVNDIWQYFKTDIVVCLDKLGAFTPDRLRTINNCTPKAFYSQMACWNRRSDYQKIEFNDSYPDRTCDISGWKYQKSYCSPFVAVQIAFRYYERDEIHLYGVDLLNHPHLNYAMTMKIKTHFINLKRALEAEGCHLIVHGDGILKDI